METTTIVTTRPEVLHNLARCLKVKIVTIVPTYYDNSPTVYTVEISGDHTANKIFNVLMVIVSAYLDTGKYCFDGPMPTSVVPFPTRDATVKFLQERRYDAGRANDINAFLEADRFLRELHLVDGDEFNRWISRYPLLRDQINGSPK